MSHLSAFESIAGLIATCTAWHAAFVPMIALIHAGNGFCQDEGEQTFE